MSPTPIETRHQHVEGMGHAKWMETIYDFFPVILHSVERQLSSVKHWSVVAYYFQANV